MRPSLGDSTQLPCPRCKGQGTIRNVESVALSVLRILEEEAMKKGTEKVIAHLPIECATFLLNEKRSAIEQIENRLKVGIVILPSKHLETPAYDIERIKEKETGDTKASYLQIKAEDITIPEFAQQVKPSIAKAAVKEFLHDSPAPVQNKNESASLIQRFWHKLVGSSAAPKSKATAAQTTERTKSTDESQPNRNRDNRQGQNQERGRDRGRGRGQGRIQAPRQERVQTSEQGQAPKQKPEQNKDLAVTNRPPRGQGRNVRRNLDPNGMPVSRPEQVNSEVADVPEVISIAQEFATPTSGEQPKRNNARRGPNRRRPRNPNYKKPEADGDSNTGGDSNNEFVERAERTDHQESQINVSSPVNVANQDSEARNTALNVESVPKPVEAIRQETE
jgi:ribonuclease E